MSSISFAKKMLSLISGWPDDQMLIMWDKMSCEFWRASLRSDENCQIDHPSVPADIYSKSFIARSGVLSAGYETYISNSQSLKIWDWYSSPRCFKMPVAIHVLMHCLSLALIEPYLSARVLSDFEQNLIGTYFLLTIGLTLITIRAIRSVGGLPALVWLQ